MSSAGGLIRAAATALALLAAASGGTRAGEPPAAAGDAIAGVRLVPNTWVSLGLPQDGGSEVAWVYDDANRLFLKYGGCCDKAKVPPWQAKGDKTMRTTPGYSNRMVAFDPAAGKWKELVAFDPSWPKDRPPNGCTRGMAWDPGRRVMWLYGGNASYGWGDYAELWKFDAATKEFTSMNAKGKAQLKGTISFNTCAMGCDPKLGKVVVANRGHRYYGVYDVASNAWTLKKQPEGLNAGGYNVLPWDPVSGRFFYLAMEETGKQAESRPAKLEDPAAGTGWFKYTNRESRRDEWKEYRSATWSYDAGADRWERLETGGAPPPRQRAGFTYDSKNKVFVLVGGSGGVWDADERFFNDTWIFDPATKTWTDPKPAAAPKLGPWATRTWLAAAYAPDFNAVVGCFEGGSGMWAYRYR